MSAQDNGGAAFPFLELDGAGMAYQQNAGMTMRDYFAAKAFPVVFADFWNDHAEGKFDLPESWRDGIAMDAYAMADAMLKARNA